MQPGYAPQQYPPPPPGYPPLSPGYPPQQPWYPPQQYVQQQYPMYQQGGYAPQQPQLPWQHNRKVALILAIVVAVPTTIVGPVWAWKLSTNEGLGFLFGWWLVIGFGLGGAGCKNTCLMMTYAVFAILYAIGGCVLGGVAAYRAWVINTWNSYIKGFSLDNMDGMNVFVYKHQNVLSVISAKCNGRYGLMFGGMDYCMGEQWYYYIGVAVLMFIIAALFATSAFFFIKARSEAKTQELGVYGGAPPTGGTDSTHQTA